MGAMVLVPLNLMFVDKKRLSSNFKLRKPHLTSLMEGVDQKNTTQCTHQTESKK
jgi:hypothetical protein